MKHIPFNKSRVIFTASTIGIVVIVGLVMGAAITQASGSFNFSNVGKFFNDSVPQGKYSQVAEVDVGGDALNIELRGINKGSLFQVVDEKGKSTFVNARKIQLICETRGLDVHADNAFFTRTAKGFSGQCPKGTPIANFRVVEGTKLNGEQIQVSDKDVREFRGTAGYFIIGSTKVESEGDIVANPGKGIEPVPELRGGLYPVANLANLPKSDLQKVTEATKQLLKDKFGVSL